jgi:A/G-specific adenine glycosylase
LKYFSLAIDSMDFKNIITSWYRLNKRELPWRETSDPYHIWVSEVILQQTRVVQGTGYYQRFIESFPTIFHLAEAHEDSVLKVWQGLGYYTRARNLHKGAKIVVEKYGGLLPESYDELLKITGIGPYSAGAIASFAFQKPVPAIDGNVYRIMSRIFGVFSSPETAEGKREFYRLVSELMDKKAPDSFNQALLDFGALQCVPRSPNCSVCPFSQHCYALRNNLIDSLPVKGKKIATRDRFFTYVLIRYKNYTFISKRKSKDIWHSLYEFPLIETNYLPNEPEIDKLPEWLKLFNGVGLSVTFISPVVKHLLSHQTIYSRFVVVEIDEVSKNIKQSYLKVYTYNISNYSVPRLIDNFLAAEPAAKYFLNPPV